MMIISFFTGKIKSQLSTLGAKKQKLEKVWLSRRVVSTLVLSRDSSLFLTSIAVTTIKRLLTN